MGSKVNKGERWLVKIGREKRKWRKAETKDRNIYFVRRIKSTENAIRYII